MFADGVISTFLYLPLVLFIIFRTPGLLCISLGNDEGDLIWDIPNRDGELPTFPPLPDLRRQSTNIANAHEVLRLTLQQFLDVSNPDLGVHLKKIREWPHPFKDEYGEIITSYKKVFLFILEQFNEFKTQNYAVNQYDKDKLHLCSVARYFSHQTSLKDRQTLMKRMSNALDYKCHPCTPYKLKQHGTLDDIQVPDIDYIYSSEGTTPDESLLLCNNTNLNTTALVIVSQSSSEVVSSTPTARPTSAIDSTDKNETKNRDGDLPSNSSFSDGKNNVTLRIANANEILRRALKSFLDFRDTELDTYLHRMIQRTENYTDEYGKVIHAYKKVFSFILQQYNEVKVNNYAVGQFDKDKLDLCSVARFLSHQPELENRQNLMKRMGDALEYRCHPCTPYKRKEHDVTIVPETDNINPDGVSPEESIILCKNHGALIETTTPNNLMAITAGLDDAPCEYSKGIINCELVRIENIKNFFSNSTDDTLEKAELIIQPSENFLPEDLISNNVRVAHLILGYSKAWMDDESGSTKLKVHPDAFRSTKNYTQKIDLNDLDCSELNLSFLSGFDQLKNFTFSNVLNMQHCLPSLPPIPNLILLDFQQCSGLGEVASFPNLTNGLIFFGFSPIPMYELSNDQTISRILDWILLSSSITLQFLKLEDNKYLTRVPDQIPSFTVLKELILRRNNISIIKTGSLTFSSPFISLNLFGNGIGTIEPGAFQGDFSNTKIYLDNNNITRFEASVFKPIYLQNLPADKEGGVVLRENPFDCSSDECHMAWFFNLRKRFYPGKFDCICLLGRCSNGTLFSELHLDAFDRCPDEDETK